MEPWWPRPPAPDPGIAIKLTGTERASPSPRGLQGHASQGRSRRVEEQSRAWVLENSDCSQERARHWCDEAASKAGLGPRTQRAGSRMATLTRHPRRGRGLISVLPTRPQREGISRSSTRIRHIYTMRYHKAAKVRLKKKSRCATKTVIISYTDRGLLRARPCSKSFTYTC